MMDVYSVNPETRTLSKVGYGGPQPKYMAISWEPSKSGYVLGPKTETTLKEVSFRLTDSTESVFFATFLPSRGYRADRKEKEYLLRGIVSLIHRLAPERILLIGTEINKMLAGPSFKNVREDHGTFFPASHLDLPDTILVPTFPMSSVHKDPRMKAAVYRDIERFFTLEPLWPDEPIVMEADPWGDDLNRIHMLPINYGSDIVLDIETTGLALGVDITMLGLEIDATSFIIESPTPAEIRLLLEIARERSARITLFNATFDISHLLHTAGDLTLWRGIETVDAMLLAHNSGQSEVLSLKHLMSLFTPLPGSRAGGDTTSKKYLALDLIGTRMVRDHFMGEYLQTSGWLMSQLTPVLSEMYVRGVRIDRPELGALLADTEKALAEIAEKLPPGINWNSTAETATALLAAGVELTEKTATGLWKTSEPVLLELAEQHEIVQDLLEYRGVSKLVTGFLKPFWESNTDRIHSRLLLHGAETGRLSSRDPNLQQIPRRGKFKSIFVPDTPEDFWGLCDLSQAELRVAALISGDELMAEALMSEDAHRFVASIVYGKPQEEISSTERKRVKGIVFGLLYGGSSFGLAKRIGVSPKEVDEVLSVFFGRFKKLSRWLKHVEQQSEAGVTKIHTAFGRTRLLDRQLANEGPRGVYRKATNTPIQGTASDIMLWVLKNTFDQLAEYGLRSRPLFTVHDSLMLNIAAEEIDIIPAILNRSFQRVLESPLKEFDLIHTLPIRGDLVIGKNWAACESTSDYYDKIAEFPMSSLSEYREELIPA